MADRIKGITVKIGGDVTQLDKALKGVNSEIIDTQKKLKEVERLLKLDPTNTELLAQKQAYLAQKVEATSTKFEELKKAQDSVTASNVKYKEWEEAFRPIKGQITETENALASLEKEQKKLQELGFAPDSQPMVELQTQITASREKLEGLKKTAADTYEALGRPVSVEQFRDLQRQTLAAGEAAKEAKKDYDSFNPTLAQVGATAEEVANKAQKAADATKGISAAAGVAAGGLVAMAVSAARTADDLNTLSQQSGMSVETLQAWEYAADRIDVGSETMISSLTKLKKNMTSSSSDVAAALNKLGLSTTDNFGQLRQIEPFFNEVIRALSQVKNETERDTLAMTLFGKSADQLAGVIDDGGVAFRQFAQEARDAGLIVSQDTLDAANQLNDKLDETKARLQATFLENGAQLAESLLPLIEDLADVIGAIIGWFASLDGETLKLLLTVFAALAGLSPVISILASAGQAMAFLSTAAGTFTIAGNAVTMTMGGWLLIIAAVVAALAILATALSKVTGKGKDLENLQVDTSAAQGIRNYSSSGLPLMANGGILSSGSAVVGEAGPELLTMMGGKAVVQPLTATVDGSSLAAALNQSGGGGSQAVNVQVTFGGSLAQLGRILEPHVTAETARRGPSLVKGGF